MLIPIKKITPKTLFDNVKVWLRDQIGENGPLPHDGAKTTLYDVWGRANGFEVGDGDNGAWVGFIGEFRAIRPDTGVEYGSDRVFLPSPIDTMILKSLERLASEEEAKPKLTGSGNRQVSETMLAQYIEFSLRIEIKRRDDLAVGYEYFAVPHVEVQASTAIEHLRPPEALEPPKATKVKPVPGGKNAKATDDE